MSRDGIAGLICLALAIGMLVLTRGLPQSSFVPIGPDFYPRIVLVIMLALSVLLIVSDIWQQLPRNRQAAAADASKAEKRNYRLVAITFALFAGYILLLLFFGYRIATFVFMVALQWVLDRPATRQRWIVLLISALATTFITYIVFDDYLSVLLPRGRWTDF